LLCVCPSQKVVVLAWHSPTPGIVFTAAAAGLHCRSSCRRITSHSLVIYMACFISVP
jgi:hypothetical protein